MSCLILKKKCASIDSFALHIQLKLVFFFYNKKIAAVHVVSSYYFDTDTNNATKVESEMCTDVKNRYGCSQLGGFSAILQQETLYYIIVTTEGQGTCSEGGQEGKKLIMNTFFKKNLYLCYI